MQKVKILLLGGTKFVGLELLKILFTTNKFEVHIASRKDLGYSNFHEIDRKNTDDLVKLFSHLRFDVVVDFISFSLPDALKLIEAIRNSRGVKPYLITISSTYVYGNPVHLLEDNVYTEKSFDPRNYDPSLLDRPQIDYYEGKKSMEAYVSQNYENSLLVRFPIILGANDYTGRTFYFSDMIMRNETINLGSEFGASNYIFSVEAAKNLYFLLTNRLNGEINCCLVDELNQFDILTLFCQHLKVSLDQVIDYNKAVTRSPFYYRKDFIVDSSKLGSMGLARPSFEECLDRELKLPLH